MSKFEKIVFFAACAGYLLIRCFDRHDQLVDVILVVVLYLSVRANYGLRIENGLRSVREMAIAQVYSRQLVITERNPRWDISGKSGGNVCRAALSIGYRDSHISKDFCLNHDPIVDEPLAVTFMDDKGMLRMTMQSAEGGSVKFWIVDATGSVIAELKEVIRMEPQEWMSDDLATLIARTAETHGNLSVTLDAHQIKMKSGYVQPNQPRTPSPQDESGTK